MNSKRCINKPYIDEAYRISQIKTEDLVII